MKLSSREAARYSAKPDPDKTALLIYGADAMRVALRRQDIVAALVGPDGEAEMRLTRLHGGELRKDPAGLGDAIRARGFFPGARVVLLEGASDAIAPAIRAALDDWAPGDAQLIVTAGTLNSRSALRKLFEPHPNAYAIALYDDPPSRDEIEAELRKAGLGAVGQDAMALLVDLAQRLDPGDLRQTIEKIALYKIGDPKPLSPEDVGACAPISTEAELDDVLHAVAEGRKGEIGPLVQRLRAQGMQPVTLCIGVARHFRQLYTAAADPGGPAKGVARLRPPVYGPRRDRLARQAQTWGVMRLRQALELITDTDLQLRSARQAPALATMERTLIRLAMLVERR